MKVKKIRKVYHGMKKNGFSERGTIVLKPEFFRRPYPLSVNPLFRLAHLIQIQFLSPDVWRSRK